MTLTVGVPGEIKPQEGRVALTPSAVSEVVATGCRVCVQTGAGKGSGYPDDAYSRAGAELLDSAADIYASGILA